MSTAGDRNAPASVGGPSWGPTDAWMVLIASELVMIVAGTIAVAVVGRSKDLPMTTTFLASLPFWLFALVAARMVVARGGHDPVAELRLHFRPIDLPIGIAVGAVAQLVVIPLLYWPLLQLFHSDTLTLEEVARNLDRSARGPLGTTLLIVMTVVAAPVVEEVLYRGLLLGALERRQRMVGLVASAAVFAALHFEPLQFVGLFVFGLILGALVQRTGRIGTSIVTHATFNAVTVATLLLRR